MDKSLNIDEIIDLVVQSITFNCSIPQFLKNEAIRRIVTQDALRYFHRDYPYAVMRTYYYVDLLSMYKNKTNGIKFITLPDEIESIDWIYQVNYSDMSNLGYLLPRNSLSFGATSQSYIAAINVSEWAESLAVLQSFGDALARYEKTTVKMAFDPNSKRLEVQTGLNKNLILEVKAHIPDEFLFGDPLFIKYVTGLAFIELGMRLSFNDMQLAGNSKINIEKFSERGTNMVTEVREQIAKYTSSGFFINKTR